MLELLITTIIPLPPFCTHPKERRECCLMSTYWKSVGPSLSFKSLLLLRHDRHHSLIHITSLWDKLNNNAPENFCTSSTEFVHPPSPAVSPPETEALHGGAGDGEAWGEAHGIGRARSPRMMLSICTVGGFCEAPLCRARSAAAFPLLIRLPTKQLSHYLNILQSNVLTFIT